MDSERSEAGEPAEPTHTPEEQAAFDERVGEMADYVHLLEAHDQALSEEMYAQQHEAAASAAPGLDRLRATDRVEERWYGIRQPVWWAIGVLLVGILVAVIAFYGGGDRGASRSTDSGGGDEAVAGAADPGPSGGPVGAAEAAEDGVVAGTWVIYADEAMAIPMYELTFQPNGSAVWISAPEDPNIQWVLDSWSYTQEGSSVEIELVQRITDARFGVDEPSNTRFHLTFQDGVMTGTMEQDTFGYETVGDTAGTVYRYGYQESVITPYAVPKPEVD